MADTHVPNLPVRGNSKASRILSWVTIQKWLTGWPHLQASAYVGSLEYN
jgi:hypothetical protein